MRITWKSDRGYATFIVATEGESRWERRQRLAHKCRAVLHHLFGLVICGLVGCAVVCFAAWCDGAEDWTRALAGIGFAVIAVRMALRCES